MPIANRQDVAWKGFLIEGLAGSEQLLLKNLQASLAAKKLPKVTIRQATVKMWWRPNRPCLDITSILDGSFVCTIHLMEYGTDLFIGVAHTGDLTNYYKQMAAACFLEAIYSCVAEVVKATAAELNREVVIKGLP